MTTIKVSSASELSTALKTASGGDTIVLADGNYGAVDISKSYGSFVTIKAANQSKAILADFDMTGGAYIKLDGVRIDNHVTQSNGAHHLEIANSSFQGMYLDNAGSNTTLINNDIVGNAVTLLNVNNVTLTGNTIHDVIGNDLLQIIGDTHHVLVENNALLDSIATEESAHPDLIQFFQDFGTGKTPHDVTIRGNLLYDDPNTGALGAQGIFIKDPGPSGYKNILVEDNLIASVLYNALTIQGGVENVVLRDNTITQGRIWVMEFDGGNGGTVVQDNVTPVLLNDGGGAKLSHNYVYGDSGSINDLFPFYVDGGTWQEYLPTTLGPIAFGKNFGAQAYLKQKLTELPPNSGSEGSSISGTSKSDFIDPSHSAKGEPTATGANDRILGLAGKDEIRGGDGCDMLRGGKGRDTLYGETGDDLLTGGKGKDKLIGAGGADSFHFNLSGGQHKDSVVDFASGVDRILLSQKAFSSLNLGILDGSQFRDVGEAGTAADRIIYKADGRLFYDADGEGGQKAIQFAKLESAPDLSSLDFVVVA